MSFFDQETRYTCGASPTRIILDSFGIFRSEKQVKLSK